jgi:hypothetical protein
MTYQGVLTIVDSNVQNSTDRNTLCADTGKPRGSTLRYGAVTKLKIGYPVDNRTSHYNLSDSKHKGKRAGLYFVVTYAGNSNDSGHYLRVKKLR